MKTWVAFLATLGVAFSLGACARQRCCGSSGQGSVAFATASGAPVVVGNSIQVVAAAEHTSSVATQDPPLIWDALLRKYMKGDYFDYEAMKANAGDMAAMKKFLDWQGTADLSTMSREDQIAFYINVYNSLNVKMILEHYPVHSPLDIPGFFDKIKHPVAGESLTISEAEYDRLIANYKDMRAHFAVVCADRGCLPLKASAYTGANLDADLDAAARKFVADPRHFKVDREKGEVEISKIFEWYGEKFTKDPNLPAEKPELYLLPWVDAETRAFMEEGNYKLKIIEWNWTINEKQ